MATTASKRLSRPKAPDRIAAVFAQHGQLTRKEVEMLTGIGHERVKTNVRHPLYVPCGKRGRDIVWRRA